MQGCDAEAGKGKPPVCLENPTELLPRVGCNLRAPYRQDRITHLDCSLPTKIRGGLGEHTEDGGVNHTSVPLCVDVLEKALQLGRQISMEVASELPFLRAG